VFRNQLLKSGFNEWKDDEVLRQVLEAERGLKSFVDPRHNIAFWARPPLHIQDLVKNIQQEVAPLAGPGSSCLMTHHTQYTKYLQVSGLFHLTTCT
jgi:hypothetical protein